jgi:hypothetical protein
MEVLKVGQRFKQGLLRPACHDGDSLPHLPSTVSALRSGMLGICINPEKGYSSSRIKNRAPATDIALTKSVTIAIALRGANNPKLTNSMLSQKTTTTRKTVEI